MQHAGVLGRVEVEDGLAEPFIAIAEELAEGAVEIDVPAFGVLHESDGGAVVHEQPEPLLAFAQGQLFRKFRARGRSSPFQLGDALPQPSDLGNQLVGRQRFRFHELYLCRQFLERASQRLIVMLPAGDRRRVNRLADLQDAGRSDRPPRLIVFQTARLPVQTAPVHQAASTAFQVRHQLFIGRLDSTGSKVNTVVESRSTPSVCVQIFSASDGRRLAHWSCSFESCSIDGHAEWHGLHFPRRCQGRKFVLGVDLHPGLLVVMLGGHGDASWIARAESL